MHEASLSPYNTFLTVTYDDDHIPEDGHLRPRDLTLFLKRLRDHSTRDRRAILSNGQKIRYFACGEYGERTNRPHYHAILFNAAFTDTHQVGVGRNASALLAALWPHGHNVLGEATFESARYVARYAMKKQGQGDHDADGVYRPAPFLRMSLKPAIGLNWLHRYKNDVQHGYLIDSNRNKTSIPRYYKKKLTQIDPDLGEQLDQQIYQRMLTAVRDSPERREVEETVHTAKAKFFERRII
jgi:hypothetical protein